MPLSDAKVRAAKPADKPYKLADERGLHLLVKPTGSRLWRFRYHIDGKEKMLSLGIYPDIGLREARDRRDEARRQVAQGIDPSAVRQATKQARINTFEAVAREWHAKHSAGWVGAHAAKILRRFERDIFPWIGARPVGEVSAPELLATIRRIEARGALETAHRTLQTCGQVFRYAIATGRADRDTAADLRGALPPARAEHFSAMTEPAKVAGLLRAIDGYQGTFIVRCALQLAPLVFVRPGELRTARWADIDLDAATWNFAASKTGAAHVVPLARQAVAILRELHPLTGRGAFVFPSVRGADRPMSGNSTLAALRRMGIDANEMTAHGFRAMARTILDEVLGYRPDWIEQQLAHAVRDPLGRAYNRTAYLEGRRQMMQAWADYLDRLKAGADVIQLPLRGARTATGQ